MKFDINALASQKFKALVRALFPTEQLDNNGNTVTATVEFVGVFQCIPVDVARQQLVDLQKQQEKGDALKTIELVSKQIEQYFIGFEAAPGAELPFTNNGEPLASNPDNIRLLLNSKEIRDAVQHTWQDARSKDVLAKNSGK